MSVQQEGGSELKLFGLTWSDGTHKFDKYPQPIAEADKPKYRYPNAIIYAKNPKDARTLIEKINKKYSATKREEIPNEFEQNVGELQ